MKITIIKLKEINETLFQENENLFVWIEDFVDDTALEFINQNALVHKNTKVQISFVPNIEPKAILSKIPNVQHIKLSPSYDLELTDLSMLNNIKYLKSLSLGDYTKKTISFKTLQNCTTLETFNFNWGLNNQNQYDFVNQQTNLKNLWLRTLDLKLINKNENLTTLRIDSVIKSEELLAEKFPNLKRLHLHGCSKLTNHAFVENLEKIEEINISYNSHLKSFPQLKHPDQVKSIEMYTCPNFNSIESLLQYKNLERLVLTSHDKKLQANINDFAKLKNLKKLKTVYTAWGNRPKEELEVIAKIYQETNWINHQ